MSDMFSNSVEQNIAGTFVDCTYVNNKHVCHWLRRLHKWDSDFDHRQMMTCAIELVSMLVQMSNTENISLPSNHFQHY